MRLREIGILWLIVASGVSHGAQQGAVIGAGTFTCKYYVEAQSDLALKTVHLAWVQGYLSGLNIGNATSADQLVLLPNGDELNSYMTEYCSEDLDELPMKGALALFRQLKARAVEGTQGTVPADNAPEVSEYEIYALDALADLVGCASGSPTCGATTTKNIPKRDMRSETSTSSQGKDCVESVQCGPSSQCVKAPMHALGKCMRATNEYGATQHGAADSQQVVRCDFNVSCPIGTHCDQKYKICVR